MLTGRLIIDEPAPGVWNMSVDQAILENATATGQFTLRFYYWSPATISLGYFQPYDDRGTHAASRDCPIVRRATGGGAIMHDHELTYSFCVPSQNRWSNQNQEIYNTAHNALIRALANWNVHAELFQSTVKKSKEPFLCFQRRAMGDVVIDSHKICGSAQRRNEKSILQHGSVLLNQSEFAPELLGICEISESQITSSELGNVFCDELSQGFGLAFHHDELSSVEQNRAIQISEERFANPEWTHKR
jgi:lipoate-protein ligase A